MNLPHMQSEVQAAVAVFIPTGFMQRCQQLLYSYPFTSSPLVTSSRFALCEFFCFGLVSFW